MSIFLWFCAIFFGIPLACLGLFLAAMSLIGVLCGVWVIVFMVLRVIAAVFLFWVNLIRYLLILFGMPKGKKEETFAYGCEMFLFRFFQKYEPFPF